MSRYLKPLQENRTANTMIKKKKQFRTGKKILGTIFKVMAGVLAFIVLVRLPELVRAFNGVRKVVSAETDSYQSGYAIGFFIYWLLHIGLATVFWMLGKRWAKRNAQADDVVR